MKLTEKQHWCLIKTLRWQLYWKGFTLNPNTRKMLIKIERCLSSQLNNKKIIKTTKTVRFNYEM